MKETQEFLKEHLSKNDTVVIGCSGGPDSMCLMHLVLSFKDKLDLKIICAHINHNVRKESIDEAKYVKEYCQNNDIIFEDMVIKDYNDDNFHNQARNIRYEFFEGLVKKYNAQYLMTAHHADDLMETVLMRITRGSSFTGYRGFDQVIYKNQYTILRPLYYLTKDEIITYNQENKIKYCEDYTNDEDHYTRNRYRHHVLPFLKNEESNVHQKFIKFHNMLKEYDDYISNLMFEKLDSVFKEGKLNLDKFHNLDLLIQNRIIEEILHIYYSDDLFLINDNHINSIWKLIESKKANAEVTLPNNKVIRKEYGELIFDFKNIDGFEYEYELSNIVHLPFNKTIEIVKDSDSTSNYVTRLSSKELKLPLRVRTRKPGDKIAIKNLNGTKKIKEVFIESKINNIQRYYWPVVVDANDNIVFLPGLKKSKFDKEITDKYDIILRYYEKEEEK